MNRIAISLILATSVVLIGCQAGTSPVADKGPGTPAASDFKVALLTPGKVSDSGWNALAYRGLQAVKTNLGAEVNNQEAQGSAIKDSLRSYAQQGYSLVFGHGYEYNAPSIEVAKDFPKTFFVSSSGSQTAENVGTFRFNLEQGFYLAGVLAAKMSKTGVIAEIGGMDVPSIASTFKAYDAGAKSIRPDIKILKVYTGDFDDVAKMQSATEQLIAQKADVVIHQANNAAQGVFNACKSGHVYAFGSNADQNSIAPDTIIASATIIADPAFIEIAKAVKSGTYKGQVSQFGMSVGAIDFVINPKLASVVPADITALIAKLKDQIKQGKLVVPQDKF